MMHALYVTPEDDDTRINERLRTLGGPAPTNLRIMLADQFQALATQYSHVRLAQFFDGYLTANPTTKMLILDTEAVCRAVWDGSRPREKDIKARDYGETREFDQLALRHRCFIGLVNHTSKRKSGGYLDLHELVNRTNTAMAGVSGSIVLADPPDRQVGDDEDKRRVLGIRGRDIRDDIMLAVEQEPNATFRTLGPWSMVTTTDAEEEILEAAAKMPAGWITARDIAEAIGKKAGTVQRAVTRMVKAGRTTWNGYRVETKKGDGLRLVPVYGEHRG